MSAGAALAGGFADPPRQSAHAFRALLSAMARPGRIEALHGAAPPAPLSPAAGTLLLTLCDPETPVHLAGDADSAAIRAWIAFFAGAPIAGPEACHFALGTWAALMPIARFPTGTPEYPDRSATLIVEMPALRPAGAALRGPGIADVAYLSLPEVAPFQRNAGLFPLGVDVFLTSGTQVASVPRTTQVASVPRTTQGASVPRTTQGASVPRTTQVA